jgi:uncharacterized membrane protein YagU involved in acid resistance
MQMRARDRNRDVSSRQLAEGAIVGLVGGFVGTFFMTQCQSMLSSLISGRSSTPQREPGRRQDMPATELMADEVSQAVQGEPVSDEYKPLAGQIVHYTFGALVGGAYGALSKRLPQVRMGSGVPFGLAVWLLADELALPILKLTPPPQQHALSRHLYPFTSHVVFGLATHAATRAMQIMLDRGRGFPRPFSRTAAKKREPEPEGELDYGDFIAAGA